MQDPSTILSFFDGESSFHNLALHRQPKNYILRVRPGNIIHCNIIHMSLDNGITRTPKRRDIHVNLSLFFLLNHKRV